MYTPESDKWLFSKTKTSIDLEDIRGPFGFYKKCQIGISSGRLQYWGIPTFVVQTTKASNEIIIENKLESVKLLVTGTDLNFVLLQ